MVLPSASGRHCRCLDTRSRPFPCPWCICMSRSSQNLQNSLCPSRGLVAVCARTCRRTHVIARAHREHAIARASLSHAGVGRRWPRTPDVLQEVLFFPLDGDLHPATQRTWIRFTRSCSPRAPGPCAAGSRIHWRPSRSRLNHSGNTDTEMRRHRNCLILPVPEKQKVPGPGLSTQVQKGHFSIAIVTHKGPY